MATIIRDSFDFAQTPADLGMNHWDIVGSHSNIKLLVGATDTRFELGQAFQMNGLSSSPAGLVNLGKSFGNETTVFINVAAFYPLLFAGVLEHSTFQLLDGVTPQISICFRSDGNIIVKSGGTSGTVLATFVAAYSAALYTHYQFKIVIDPSAGSVELRKNGNASNDFAVTGVNTRGGTSNTYANNIQFQTGKDASNSFPTGYFILDDVWIFGGSGGAPNTWLGDTRAVQIMPNSDNTTHFTRNASTFEVGLLVDNSSASFASATLRTVCPFVARDGTVVNATLATNGFIGNLKLAIYDDTGAALLAAPGQPNPPGALVAASGAVTSPASGTTTFTFGSPPTLVGGRTYWLCVLSDANFTAHTNSAAQSIYVQAQPYASGFPSTFSPTISGGNYAIASAIVTPTGNFSYVQDATEDGSISFVKSATVGDVDLYGNPGLPFVPQSIVGLSQRAFMSKDNAGSRQGSLRFKSGATTVDSTGVPLSSSPANVIAPQDTDPNTSAAWTASGILALLFGPKVDA